MRKLTLLLLFIGFLHAQPSCDVHQYHDFVWESGYSAPVRPADTILDNCADTGVDPAICNSFANPNLTISDKRQLVLDGLVNASAFPDFGAAKKMEPEYSLCEIRARWGSHAKLNQYPRCLE